MQVKERTEESVFSDTLLSTLKSFRKGDFGVRMRLTRSGIAGEIASTINEIIEQNERLTKDLQRLSKVVGKEGKIGARASIGNVTGSWGSCVDSVNSLISDLVRPTAEVTRVIGSVAKGDLTQSIPLETEGRPIKGEFLRTAKLVNTMVDQLAILCVGSDARRARSRNGRKARRPGGSERRGRNVERPHRQRELHGEQSDRSRCEISPQVTTAVANGDLSKKITVDVQRRDP